MMGWGFGETALCSLRTEFTDRRSFSRKLNRCCISLFNVRFQQDREQTFVPLLTQSLLLSRA